MGQFPPWVIKEEDGGPEVGHCLGKCLPKEHVLKAWSLPCSTTGGCRTWRCLLGGRDSGGQGTVSPGTCCRRAWFIRCPQNLQVWLYGGQRPQREALVLYGSHESAQWGLHLGEGGRGGGTTLQGVAGSSWLPPAVRLWLLDKGALYSPCGQK